MFCIAICTGGVFTGASLETGKAVTLAECLKVHYTRQVLSSQELNRKEESETCVRAAPAEQALPRVNVFLSVWLQVDIRSSQAKNQLKCYCDSLIKAITSAAACCAVRTTASLTSVRGTAGSSREPFRLQWVRVQSRASSVVTEPRLSAGAPSHPQSARPVTLT